MTKVIVGMDESDGAAAALQWAVREGRLRDWPVTAVLAWDLLDQHPVDSEVVFDPGYDDEAALEALAAYVVRAVGQDAAAGVALRAVCDVTAGALIDQAQPEDLLVVGARGLGGFASLLLGSVSNHCIHYADSPVVVVRGSPADRPPHTPERIVVGVDGSDTARAGLRWALDEARLRHADVQVVHAWRYPVAVGPYAIAAFDPTGLEEAARQALDAMVDAEDTSGLSVVRTVVCGGAALALIDASRDADLVVVGSRGLGGVKRALLGSVSDQVAHHALCPVLVVRPHG